MNTKSIPDANAEIKPLTSLRAIAALLVFLYHFGGIPYGTTAKNLLELIMVEGQLGVTIFFVLSGFLITLKYFSDPRAEQPVRARSYIIKRVARIYPQYFFILLVGFIFLAHPPFNLQTLTNLTLTQGYFMKYAFTGLPTAWSLTVEESFYLSAPVFFWIFFRCVQSKWFQKISPLALLGAALMVAVVLLNVAGRILYQISAQTPALIAVGFMYDTNIGLVFFTTFFFRAFDFAVGIFCAYFYRYVLTNALWKKPFAPAVALTMAVVALVGYCAAAYLLNTNHAVVGDALAVLCAGLMILALTLPGTVLYRVLSFPLFPYLGRISYTLYLVQLSPLGTAFLEWTATPLDAIAEIKTLWLYMRFNLLSAVLYQTVERPAHRLITGLNRGAERGAAQARTNPSPPLPQG